MPVAGAGEENDWYPEAQNESTFREQIRRMKALVIGGTGYPAMGRVPDVLAAIKRAGFSLIGHFTLPDEAWREDFYGPMEIRIEDLRAKYRADEKALAVLEELAQEPETHRRHSDCYACDFFVARRADGKNPQ